MPAARAAVSREPPSSTSARTSIRRAARASGHRAASRRSSPAPSSRRVIATTIGPLPTGPYRRINRRGPRDAPGTRPVRNNGRWYEDAMLAAAQAGVHLTTGEGDGQEALPLPHALERGLELPARIEVIERRGRAGAQHLLEHLGHGVEIVHRLQADGLVLMSEVAGRPT